MILSALASLATLAHITYCNNFSLKMLNIMCECLSLQTDTKEQLPRGTIFMRKLI